MLSEQLRFLVRRKEYSDLLNLYVSPTKLLNVSLKPLLIMVIACYLIFPNIWNKKLIQVLKHSIC